MAGAVALGLEQGGDGGVFASEAELGSGQAHLAETGAIHALAGDEGGAASGAALLGVIVNELGTFFGDPVDVGRFVAHQAVAITAQIALADVIAPEDQNVGLAVGHGETSAQTLTLCMGITVVHSGADLRCVLKQRKRMIVASFTVMFPCVGDGDALLGAR